MLQIIIFQLSAMILLIGSLNKNSAMHFVAFALAVAFVLMGLAQGEAIPSFSSY